MLRAALSRDELARAARCHFERDRRAFVVVRGALRILLGRYLARRPEALTLGEHPRGKPYLIADPDLGVRFNVSHSGELGLLAFARDRELGIDVEHRAQHRDWFALAEHSFTAEENAVLRALPEADRVHAFFSCWARKEAFIKATGQGISQLGDVEVTLRPGEPARLLRTPSAPGVAMGWSMIEPPPLPGYASALVVEGQHPRLSYWLWDVTAGGAKAA
jgi:4'-phosphopantetheinyl transferase